MVHLFLYGVLAVVLAACLFFLATRFLPAGEQIAPPLRDEPPWELPPERPLSADDVDGVRLPVALRGYRFAETDLLLDRLAAELRARDAEIDRLRGTSSPRPSPPRPFSPQSPSPQSPSAEPPSAQPPSAQAVPTEHAVPD